MICGQTCFVVKRGVYFMKANIYQSEVSYLKELKNLFIEMTAKNCNQRCKHCYIDFPKYSKKISDFISIDVVKQALCDTQGENIECIYLKCQSNG
jgi:MoaA/NifB/PqqE/SkfB family radical SAM enzyme